MKFPNLCASVLVTLIGIGTLAVQPGFGEQLSSPAERAETARLNREIADHNAAADEREQSFQAQYQIEMGQSEAIQEQYQTKLAQYMEGKKENDLARAQYVEKKKQSDLAQEQYEEQKKQNDLVQEQYEEKLRAYQQASQERKS
jgi:hypothetical protein